jgi:hypothetical protein
LKNTLAYYNASVVVVNSGANPTITSYNAIGVKLYNVTSSLERFKDKNKFFCFEKHSGVVVVNSEVVEGSWIDSLLIKCSGSDGTSHLTCPSKPKAIKLEAFTAVAFVSKQTILSWTTKDKICTFY